MLRNFYLNIMTLGAKTDFSLSDIMSNEFSVNDVNEKYRSFISDYSDKRENFD